MKQTLTVTSNGNRAKTGKRFLSTDTTGSSSSLLKVGIATGSSDCVKEIFHGFYLNINQFISHTS